MNHLLTGFVFIFLASLVSLAHATEEYRPFSAKIPLPSELQEEARQFVLNGPVNFQSREIPLKNATLHLHPVIADLWENIERSQGLQNLPIFEACRMRSALEAFGARNEEKFSSMSASVLGFCAKLERPELLFVQKDLFDPGFLGFISAMTTLEENIGTIVTPFEKQGIAFSFFDVATSQKIRLAFLRVAYRDLKRSLNETIDQISAFEKQAQGADKTLAQALGLAANFQMQRIMELNNTGIAAYKADALAVGARGKSRDSLPYPNLSDEDRRHLSVYVMAMIWRFRGGGMVDKPTGTQMTRIYFAQRPYAVLGKLNGLDDSSLGSEQFSRLAARGWGQWFDMGRTDGGSPEAEISDLVHMTTRGLYQVEGSERILQAHGFSPVALRATGLQFGACYLYAWERLPGLLLRERLEPPFRPFFDGPTSWGELCAGAVLGLGLSDSLLEGR